MGIRQSAQLRTHPLRGLLFENWVMTELYKVQCNQGHKPNLYFMRDQQGREVDAVVETAPQQLHLIEIKSGETIASDWFAGLKHWRAALSKLALEGSNKAWVIYGGTSSQSRSAAEILAWTDMAPLFNQIG